MRLLYLYIYIYIYIVETVRNLVIRYDYRLSVRKTPTSHAGFTPLFLRPENMYINFFIYRSEGNFCWFEAATNPAVSLLLLLLTHITESSEALRRLCPAVSGGECSVSAAATM